MLPFHLVCTYLLLMYGIWCALTYHINEPLLIQHNQEIHIKVYQIFISSTNAKCTCVVSFYSLDSITKEEKIRHTYVSHCAQQITSNMTMVGEQMIKIEVGELKAFQYVYTSIFIYSSYLVLPFCA